MADEHLRASTRTYAYTERGQWQDLSRVANAIDADRSLTDPRAAIEAAGFAWPCAEAGGLR